MSDRHPLYDWPATAAAAGIDYVSPRDDSIAVIGAIATAPLVLAESLHAAVIADAFRVPWRPVRSDVGSFNLFKWHDWTESLGVPLEVTEIFAPLTRARRLARWPGRRRAAGAPRPAAARRSDEVPAVPPPTLRRRLMARLRVEVGARMLAQASLLPAFLSGEPVLKDRLDRIEMALAGVARDYGMS
jgi:succinoglycan biosynthesis protein ExoV